MLITEDSKTPLCQQFDSFYTTLLSMVKQGNLDVYDAILKLEPKSIEDFTSEKADYLKSDAETLKRLSIPNNSVNQKCSDDIHEEDTKNVSERHKAYESELKKTFHLVAMHVDLSVYLELKWRENWEDISREEDTIRLLKILRDECYRIDENPSPVDYHRERNRFIEQFVGCKQKKGQRIDDYIAEMQSYYNVLKVHGKGRGVFRSEPLIKHTIRRKFPEFQGVEFDSLGDSDKRRIEKAADRIVVATAIVEGSKSSWKNDRIRNYANIAGVHLTPRNRNAWIPLQCLEVNEIAVGIQMCAAW